MHSRSHVLFLSIAFVIFLQLPQMVLADIGTTSALRSEPLVLTPKSISGRLPLVVLLHGYAGNSEIMNYYFGLDEEVEARRFILVVPNGNVDSSGLQYWNATPACCDFDHSGIDDVGYLSNLIREIKNKYRIDSSKVFVVGHSNGAFMANRLACEPHSPIRGIVSFAGAGFLNGKDCRATHSVSVLQIHAVDDDTIHFDGDRVGYPKLQLYPSVAQTIDQWRIVNSCSRQSQIEGSPVQVTRFASGDDTDTFSWDCAKPITLWRIRASESFPHSPHSPFLTDAFAGLVLDFLGLHLGR